MFLPALLLAINVTWQTGLDRAIEQAHHDRNLVVVGLTNECVNCEALLTRFIDETSRRAPIAFSHSQLILVRARAMEVASRNIRISGRAAIAILDPSGRLISLWTDLDDMNGYSEFLTALRQQRENLAHAAELRAEGQEAQADYLLASALLEAWRPEEAIPMLDSVQQRFEESGDLVAAETARLRRAIADLALRRTHQAMNTLREITAKPVDPQNAANAWLVMAEVYQSFRMQKPAAEAYREAQKLAGNGTAVAAAAESQVDLLSRKSAAERSHEPGGRAKATLDVPFSVRLTSPSDVAAEGPVVVAAEPQVPSSRKLERVDLYWNEQKIASRKSAPFQTSFEMGAAQTGYFRAVATLDDGTTAEDSRLINVAAAERVDVQGVNFVAAVRDLLGRHITGLKSRDFIVAENGRGVDVSASSSLKEPVTIGIALDTSGSIRGHMLDVQEVAASMIDELMRGGRSAFQVSFDSRPQLVNDKTKDSAALKQSLYDLRASGATSIFDAIAYSLRFFDGVKGKRALVVLTDGIDTASGYSYDIAATAAREAGVPVYVVLHGMGSGAIRLDGTSPLQRLVEKTGGRIYAPALRSRLNDVFHAIRDEVDAQYVLSYQSPSDAPKWRNVSVDVRGRAAIVKSIVGYVPR